MKKKLTRILAVLLIAMMLVPTIVTIVANAEETEPATDLVNVYDPATATVNAVPSVESGALAGATTGKNGYVASTPIAVAKNQYIYVGPCPAPTDANSKNLEWVVAWYKSDGKYTAFKRIIELKENVVDTFDDGSVIYKIKVNNNNYKQAALATLATYKDYVLMTIDQPFTKEDYYAYADAQGWDINAVGLRPTPPKYAPEAPEGFEGIWNLFPREGERDPLLRQHQNNEYVMSDYIPVVPGDVITMGAISSSETRSVLYAYDADFKEIKNYKRTDIGMDFVENIGYNFAIYSHTVPAKSEENPDAKEVAYIKVCVHSGIYNDGDMLVTRNNPFTGEELRATLGIEDLSDEAKAHPFYGKNALFVGDSISYGSYDTPPTYRNPSASWARRLALATGLIPTNVSYPGASVGKTGLSNVKWEYDLLKTALMSKKDYDMIIFQGGVNDARQNIPVGEALPADTDRKVLVENERVATFAGGLQLMFKDAKDKWPEAELYYIANFKLVSDSVRGKDMSEYYEQATILCAEYGVHYIDLYEDAELYETFDYESSDILPDLIHPISASYDLLFPTILRLFNATIPAEDDKNEGTVEPEITTPESNAPTTPDADNAGDQTTAEPKGMSTGLIIAIAAVAVAVAAAGVVVFLKKKKK